MYAIVHLRMSVHLILDALWYYAHRLQQQVLPQGDQYLLRVHSPNALYDEHLRISCDSDHLQVARRLA